MTTTNIEWAEHVWNPISGCTRVSPGCDNCYAVQMTHRLEKMGQEKYAGLTVLNPRGERHFNGKVKCHDDALDIPLKRKKPTRWFVNSMSDLFHREVPDDFIDKVFAVMALCPQHQFLVLTKRPERMAEYCSASHERDIEGCANWLTDKFIRPLDGELYLLNELGWPLPNVWLGASVENQKAADERIPHLLKCPAAIRFLSCEPLLVEVDIITPISKCADDDTWRDAHEWAGECELCGGEGVREYRDSPDEWGEDCPSEENHLIDCRECAMRELDVRVRVAKQVAGNFWVIVGGESGPGARPCNIAWIESIVSQCKLANVPVFVKQLGAEILIPNDSFSRWPNEGDGLLYDADCPGWDYQGELVVVYLLDKKGGDMSEWPEHLRVRELPKSP